MDIGTAIVVSVFILVVGVVVTYFVAVRAMQKIIHHEDE